MTVAEKVQKDLMHISDEKYGDFSSKLIPGIARETVLGVRTPDVRKYAKAFAKSPESEEFLKILPHKYYEENNLHGFIIETMKDYERVVYELERFFPYIDNWATCDLISPKIFKKHRPELYLKIQEWIKSGKTYTIRFGVGMLMSHFLDEDFSPEMPKLVAEIESEEYYVNMMSAWYFATALAKQYDSIVPFIENKTLDKWVHNKTIQKSVESYRISDEKKSYLKSLKIK